MPPPATLRGRCRGRASRKADGTGQPGHPARGRMAGNGARRSWRWRKDGQGMKVGIPAEVKNNEFRVAITPSGVHELTRAGHEVYVQQRAGVGSSIPDEDFVAAGARILPGADDVWQAG